MNLTMSVHDKVSHGLIEILCQGYRIFVRQPQLRVPIVAGSIFFITSDRVADQELLNVDRFVTAPDKMSWRLRAQTS
jgi:hypothetical protein